MGSVMAKVMDENMKKTQEFMLQSQKMQLERQVQMQQQMRQRMVANQLAMARERMYWWSSFYGLCLVGLTAGYMKTRHPLVIAPLLPLTFVVGYQADLAWGNKIKRVLDDTEKILANEQSILALPGKPLTVKLLDEERKKQQK